MRHFLLSKELEKLFLEIERFWKLKESADHLLPEVLSDLHTIKGNSAMMGFVPIQSTSHTMEDLCAVVNKKKSACSAVTADLLIQGGDLLLRMIEEAPHGEIDGGPAQEYSERVSEHIKNLSERRKRVERRSSPEWRTGSERRSKDERRSTPPKGTSSENVFGKTSDTVRIDFKRLDTLLETVGEGIISHSALVELHRQLSSLYGNSKEVSLLEQAIVSQGKTLKDLQRNLMDSRLVPISTIFSRFSSVG